MLLTTDNMEIFVGNLSFDITEEDLQQTFESFGVVSRLKIITDRDTGRSRGFAFVTMDSAEEAKAAIEDLDGKDNMGRALSVREATPRAPRDGGGGGGNYRGGGGGGGGNYRGGR
jgi:RNA recognition motif-containing protein